MTAYDFISKKENQTEKMFNRWSLSQLKEFMNEYAYLCFEKSISYLREEKDLDNVIDTLDKFNQYRRDENVPSKVKMISPKELGEAIDKAIEILKTLK
jgi:hypothetical protein